MADTDLREQIARALNESVCRHDEPHPICSRCDADAVLAVVTPALAAAHAEGREDGLCEGRNEAAWMAQAALDAPSYVAPATLRAIARLRAPDGRPPWPVTWPPASSGEPT